MPEGHTLHRLARLHQRRFAGSPVRVSSPQGRFAEDAALIDGRVLVRSDAWGKHLWHHYENGLVVHVHLGLYGKFTESPLPLEPPVGQVRMRMAGTEFGTDLRGPTACEVLHEPQVAAIEARLGPDPLRADADPDRAWARISKSQTPIGALLMDQAVLAGVGNVYRAEVLFRHRIHPLRPGRTLRVSQWRALWDDLVVLMADGVRVGRIDTVRPEHTPEAMGRPPRQDDHGGEVYVYRRTGQPCLVCGSTIRTDVLVGRNIFWCPQCQRRFRSRALQ